MNVLYLNQYLKTLQPGGTRFYLIAQELIKAGHSVTMVSSSDIFDHIVK